MKDLPVPDVVLLCVKGYGLDEALRQIAAHSHDGTVVIPLLNGIDIHERIRAQLPNTRVLPACVFVGTHVDRPGVISQAGGDGVIFLGGDPDDPGFVPVRSCLCSKTPASGTPGLMTFAQPYGKSTSSSRRSGS